MQLRTCRNTQLSNEWLDRHIAGIVDRARAQQLQMSVEREASGEGEGASDGEVSGWLEEKALTLLKKQKFSKIFRQTHSHPCTTSTLKHDPCHLYQSHTLHEPCLPLPTKVTNGTLSLLDYSLSPQ